VAKDDEGDSKPDLLIGDVIMPGMTGVELAIHFRKAQPDSKVLLVSDRRRRSFGRGPNRSLHVRIAIQCLAAIITIGDNGAGIPESMLETLVGSFRDNKSDGNGLGAFGS
jgi:DNA-binding NarL/FixJ family response regulator